MQSFNETDENRSFVLDESLRLSFLLLILLLALFGIVSNCINLFVFVKLKRADPINLPLLALALSDSIICMTSFVFFLSTSQYLTNRIMFGLKVETVEVFFLVFNIPHKACVRVTILITSFIAFERCLCIAMPLKVKNIITQNRVLKFVVFSFCSGILYMVPIYSTNPLAWVYVPELNQTLLQHVMTEEFYAVSAWYTPADVFFILVVPFVILVVCTAIMIKYLKKRMHWRQQAINNFHGPLVKDAAILREKRIIKMVMIMSVVFLICYTPNIALTLNTTFVRSSSLQNYDSHTLQVIYYFGYLLDTINSSINIFIYYFNSANYKNMLIKSFRCKML